MSRRPGVDPVLLLQVAAAALLGGTLAVAALAVLSHIHRAKLVAGFVVAVVVFSVLVVASLLPELRGEAGSGQPAGPQPGSQQPASGFSWANMRPNEGSGGHRVPSVPAPAAPAAPAARWDPAPHSGPEPTPVSVAVPVPGGAWWRSASARARTSAPGAAAPEQVPPVTPLADVSDEAGATQLVQCPRCGDFRVDVRQQAPGFAFTCKRCDHHWRWEPGSAWPTTVVRPRLKRRPGPGGDAEPI
jgi:hypothetical protein